MNVIQLAFASVFILAILPTLAGANSVQSAHVHGVLERPKHTGGEGGIAPVAVTSGRPRVRVLHDPIVANVENIHVGVDEVASASPAEVLREDDVDVIAVNVDIEPRSDREEVALTIDDDSMITNASDFDPSRGQFERIVASSRKLEPTCPGGKQAFAATDGGYNGGNGVLYNALRNYAATGNVADMYGSPLNCWNVAAVTDFGDLFYNMNYFNDDISSWETGQVTKMWGTFYNAEWFNQPLSAWDTSKVATMSHMFSRALNFNQPVSSWDTNKVTDMEGMFINANKFNQELCSWGQNYKITNKYQNMFMRSGCPTLSDPSFQSPWCSTTSQDTCPMLAQPSTSPSESPSAKPSTSPSAHPSTSPSKSPSAKPSTSPSVHPSTSPSESPSAKPSTSPRKSPSILGSMDMWQIILTSLEANFTANSDTELLLQYDIGKDATSDGSAVLNYMTKLYQKDCITELPTSGTGPLLFNLTDNGRITKSPVNDTFDELRLVYNVNKTLIASSPVWNRTANKIEVCQEVHLIEESAILGQMSVVKDQRDVVIEFNLDVNISLGVGLGEVTSVLASTATGVDDYITAYKCDDNFDQDDSPLVPNEILSVCIESNSIDVEINEIETMTLIQGAANLPIILNSLMSSPRITGNTIVSPIKQVVSTLVPFNLITFAKGQSMAVEGKVVMQLVESSARRLQDNFGTGSVKAAAFAVNIVLQPKAALADGVELHSSASIASRAFISLGVVLAFVVW